MTESFNLGTGASTIMKMQFTGTTHQFTGAMHQITGAMHQFTGAMHQFTGPCLSLFGSHISLLESHISLLGSHISLLGPHISLLGHTSVYWDHTSVYWDHTSVYWDHTSVYWDHTSVYWDHTSVYWDHLSRNLSTTWEAGSRVPFQSKYCFTRFGDSHYHDKTDVRLSYLYDGNFYTRRISSLYWESPREPLSTVHHCQFTGLCRLTPECRESISINHADP